MSNVLITGTGRGIGRETALLFLERGYTVHGIDIRPSSIENKDYHHHVADVSEPQSLPDIDDVDILINAAGVQGSGNDISVNLQGTVNVTEKYGVKDGIKAVLNIASASAHTGAEFPSYSASKGGIISYTRNVAIRIAPYGATCNSISPGGVLTESNSPVINDEKLWAEIMALTPLKKWATEREIAEWIYFICVVNRSMSGEDILIDNGESHLSSHFVWPEG
jgi:3-oxoacyl-[acyl-carrier protein] reductase